MIYYEQCVVLLFFKRIKICSSSKFEAVCWLFGETEYKTEEQPCSVSSIIVQELCESRGGRPGLFVLTSLLASVDVKVY